MVRRARLNLPVYVKEWHPLLIFYSLTYISCGSPPIGQFTVVYLVAKPLIWSEAEGDLVMIETYHKKVAKAWQPSP